MSESMLTILLLILTGITIFGPASAVIYFTQRAKPRPASLGVWWRSTYTMHRWGSNPYQMYIISILLTTSITQLTFGVAASSVQADQLDYASQTALAVANLIGAAIAILGLHMKDIQTALWIEFFGLMSLIVTLGIWVFLVYITVALPNTSYGLNLSEACVLASIHRSIQIIMYKRARRIGNRSQQIILLNDLERGGDPYE